MTAVVPRPVQPGPPTVTQQSVTQQSVTRQSVTQQTELTIWTDQSANRCVLRLRGHLSATTVGVLDRHVDRLGCRWCDEVVIDVGRLERLDPIGARLLVGLGHYVAGRGGHFEIDGGSPEIGAMVATAAVELEA